MHRACLDLLKQSYFLGVKIQCGLCLRAVTQSPLETSTVRPSHQSLSLAEKLARWNEGGVGGGGVGEYTTEAQTVTQRKAWWE